MDRKEFSVRAILAGQPVPRGLDREARRAVTDCPALALKLYRPS